MGLYARAAVFVVVFTLGFILFGIVVGIGACASVQGIAPCLNGFLSSFY